MTEKTEQKSLKKNAREVIVRRISAAGLIITILGIADTIYLTVAHYTTATILACPSTSFINCAKVTTSVYSEIFGIPVALLGLLFFIAMFFLQLPTAWRTANEVIRIGRLVLSVSGMGMVFWLLFAELDRLRSICLFCTGVHILTFGLFVTVLVGTSLTSSEPAKES